MVNINKLVKHSSGRWNRACGITGPSTVHFFVGSVAVLKVPVFKCLPHGLATNSVQGPWLIRQCLTMYQTGISKYPRR